MKHFDYISKHNSQVREAYQEINQMLIELHKIVRQFTFQTEVIGSYKRNMITFDKRSNIGFDFDFNIILNENALDYKPKQIKESIMMEAFKKLALKYGFDKVENSTRVITLKKINKKKSDIIYSCDFAIVNNYEDDEGYDCQEYIHFNKKLNRYAWCEQSYGFYMLPEKVQWLKSGDDGSEIWNELREEYIIKKNKNEDKYCHSRQIFAMVVNEMCQKYGYYEED